MDVISRAQVRAVIPLGEIGTPRDIGYAALYLASCQAGFVSGQVILPGSRLDPA